ncbi:glucose oxidase [Moniliophthora roreri]|nr:glucose oxidase [Moniliophthora roreri]
MFRLLLGPAPLALHSASASPPLVKRAYGLINDSWVADGQIDFAALDTATRNQDHGPPWTDRLEQIRTRFNLNLHPSLAHTWSSAQQRILANTNARHPSSLAVYGSSNGSIIACMVQEV